VKKRLNISFFIFSLFLCRVNSINAQPTVTFGSVVNNVTGVISARWRGLNNNQTVNTALYLGNSNIGVSANRVEVGGNGLYVKPGATPIFFVYDKTADMLVASVNPTVSAARTITFTSVSTKLIAPATLCRMNYMTVLVRNLGGTSTGITTFSNVALNGFSLGTFSAAATTSSVWTVSNFDFSQSFTVTGTIVLDNGVYGASENAKVELSIGERRPISSISSPTLCATNPMTVNLSGLLPSNTYTINYTFLGSTVTPIFNTNSSGNASFTTAIVTQPNMGQVLTINTLTPSAAGACSWAAVVNNTVAALDDPICAIILPIQLVKFSGTAQGRYDDLHWLVKADDNVIAYELEYAGDGINWKRIYSTMPKLIGTFDKTTDYSYAHLKTELLRYYRLKIITNDAGVHYSKPLVLKDETGGILLYPNPGKDYVSLLQEKELPMRVTVWSVDGKLIYEMAFTSTHNSISLINWAQATYIFRIETKDGVPPRYLKFVKD
jgi:hypothetical protein